MATTKLTDSSFEILAKALRCWLDFQIHCGREQLLSESFLTQPIGEFLMSHYSGHLKREKDHPQFKRAKKGRPKQIDYVLETRDNRSLEFAVECKWTGSTIPARQAVVDDIMRLECLRACQGTCSRFLILAGRKETIAKFIIGRINKTGVTPAPCFLKGYLPIAVGAALQQIPVKCCEPYYRTYLKSFSKAYKRKLPSSYRGRLVADETGDEVRVLVWKVESTKHRTEFDFGSVW